MPRKPAEVLGSIRTAQKELAKHRDSKRPSAGEQIKKFTELIYLRKFRYDRFLSEGFHDSPDELLSPYAADNTSAAMDFLCWFAADDIIKKYQLERLKDPAGMSAAEYDKREKSLEAVITNGWVELLPLLGQLSDMPGDFPPDIFLGFDPTGRAIKNIEGFAKLTAISDREQAANLALMRTHEEIERRKAILSNYSPTNANHEEIKQQMAECDEKRRQAQTLRESQRRADEGSLALYAACCQFLRTQGIDPYGTTLRLFGRAEAITAHTDPLREGYKRMIQEANAKA